MFLVYSIWGAVIREPEPLVRNNEDPAYAIHDPFGRPGAGAPLRDSEGNVQTMLSNVSNEVKNQVYQPSTFVKIFPY